MGNSSIPELPGPGGGWGSPGEFAFWVVDAIINPLFKTLDSVNILGFTFSEWFFGIAFLTLAVAFFRWFWGDRSDLATK